MSPPNDYAQEDPPVEDEEGQEDVDFKEKLKKHYYIYEGDDDRNTMYKAVGIGLSGLGLVLPVTVRHRVFHYLNQNYETVAGDIPGSTQKEKRNYLDKIIDIEEPTVGSSVELTAISVAYEHNIIVISRDKESSFPASKTYEHSVVLWRQDQDKYRLLRPKVIQQGFQCEQCSAVLSCAQLKDLHNERDHQPHACDICSKTFSSISGRNIHRGYKHPEAKALVEEFKCRQCTQQFNKWTDLHLHVRDVHSELEILCVECGRYFKSNATLRRHQKYRHSSGQFKCEKCNKNFTCSADLFSHKRTHINLSLKCQFCKKVFSNKNNLRLHIKDFHADGSFKCTRCDYVGMTKSRLQHHVRDQHRGNHFFCKYCNIYFKNVIYLNSHNKSFHKGRRNFNCFFCNQSFPSSSTRREHQKTSHANVRPFICTVCQQSFTLRKYKNYHESQVHGIQNSKKRPTMKSCQYDCRLCKPPVKCLSAIGLRFHRFCYHPENLAPKDPRTYEDIHQGFRNRLLLGNEKDFKNFVRYGGNKCVECDTIFFTASCHFKHGVKYHNAIFRKIRSMVDFVQLKFTSRAAPLPSRKTFMKIYERTRAVHYDCDHRREVYYIAIVPYRINKEGLLEYLSNPENLFYIYAGSASYTIHPARISRHHSSKLGNVCTNQFFKICGPNKYKAFIINEHFVYGNERLKPEALVKRDEAFDQLTLFLFAKKYERENIFIQHVDWHVLNEHLTEVTFDRIQKEIDDCKGNLFDIARFEVTEAKEIQISTTGVTESDIAFSKCSRCPEREPFVSKHHAMKHRLECEKGNRRLNMNEKLLSAESFDFHSIHSVIKRHQVPENYIYLVLGCNEKITGGDLSLVTKSETYVGKCSGSLISFYHFNGKSYSSLVNMSKKWKYVYHLWSVPCDTKKEAKKTEQSLLVVGMLRRKMEGLKERFALVNKILEVYSIPETFDMSEWKCLYETAKKPPTDEVIDFPSFLNPRPKIYVMEDITQKLEKISPKSCHLPAEASENDFSSDDECSSDDDYSSEDDYSADEADADQTSGESEAESSDQGSGGESAKVDSSWENESWDEWSG